MDEGFVLLDADGLAEVADRHGLCLVAGFPLATLAVPVLRLNLASP
jgi:hypothetical protein